MINMIRLMARSFSTLVAEGLIDFQGKAANAAKARLLFCFLFSLFALFVSLQAFGSERPREIASANITLKAHWEDSDYQGKLQIDIHGSLELNQQFSSLEQGSRSVMVPYKATAMSGTYTFEHRTKNMACGVPKVSYEGSGAFTIEPVPGPGNLILHCMGDMSKQLEEVKHMAPNGAFDTLIDRYLFVVPIPRQDVKGVKIEDPEKCEKQEIKTTLEGTIQIHFQFKKDGTMSGQRSWSCDTNYRAGGADANVSVSNLPAVFNAKPFTPPESSTGKVYYDLQWEIKTPFDEVDQKCMDKARMAMRECLAKAELSSVEDTPYEEPHCDESCLFECLVQKERPAQATVPIVPDPPSAVHCATICCKNLQKIPPDDGNKTIDKLAKDAEECLKKYVSDLEDCVKPCR
jgi:hypothetical protein